jgi:glutamine synthetase type III
MYGFIVLIVLVVMFLAAAIRILNEYERGVIFRLGRVITTKGPGLIILIPVVDKMVKIDMRTITMDVPPQDVITRDNVSIKVNAVVYFRVIDATAAVINVENYLYATSQLAQTTLRSVCGQVELDEILSEREKINLQLQEILETLSRGESVKTGKGETLRIGVTNLPSLPKDITDRNRTSPFAFTGNKFEFRMVGSSASIASPAMVLNTAVADILDRFASALEKAEDLNRAVHELIVSAYTEHRRIIFNGNGYSREWVREAEKRGLPNIPSTVEAIPEYTKDYAVALFGRHGILSRQELESRASIYLEKYAKQITIEARVMVSMAEREILPSVMAYGTRLGDFVLKAREAAPDVDVKPFEEKLAGLVQGMTALQNSVNALAKALENTRSEGENHILETARWFRERVVPLMEELRRQADLLETMVPKELWPFPTYEELLFRL